MAKFTIGNGLDEYNKALEDLMVSDGYLKKAVYKGAEVIADAVKNAMLAIPTDDRKFVPEGELRKGPTTYQKKGMVKGYGITDERKANGNWNVKIGFEGYNDIVTDRWPYGQPHSMIARSVNSGTSFMQKTPFVDATVRQYKMRAEDAMKNSIDASVEEMNVFKGSSGRWGAR